jgi:hypothetical protein
MIWEEFTGAPKRKYEEEKQSTLPTYKSTSTIGLSIQPTLS